MTNTAAILEVIAATAAILEVIAADAESTAKRIKPDSHADDWVAYFAAQSAIETFADELRDAIRRINAPEGE